MGAKALLIGLDGLDDDLMEAMIAEGALPHLEKLRDKGRTAKIRNYSGMGAGAFWSSIACGASPDYHGRYFHLQFDPSTYDVKPFCEEKDYRAPGFWNTLDEDGYKVAVIDWLHGPFAPMSNGFVIDSWYGHDATCPPRSYPESIIPPVLEKFGRDPFGGVTGVRTFQSAEDYKVYVEQAVERIHRKRQFACDKLSENDWDLFAPCFLEVHDIAHYAYHISDPTHPRYDTATRNVVGDPLRICYAALDEAVGALIEIAGPDAAVMVFGGPGMRNLLTSNAVAEEITRRLDLGIEKPRSKSENAKRAYRSFLPPGLRRRIAPFARGVRKRFANDMFAQRRFIAVPHNDNSAAIRINVKGRERFGMIERGPQYDALIDEIRNGFMEIVDPDSGEKIVKRVVVVREMFNGPSLDILPDLFVEWDRDISGGVLKRIASEKIGELEIPSSHRSGDHTNRGFFWACNAAGAIFEEPGWRAPHEVTETIFRAVKERCVERELTSVPLWQVAE